MKLLMISAFAAVALFATATTMLRSHSPSSDLAGTGGMPSLQELQSTGDVSKLPVEEFEDQSLVYSRVPKH